jgi:aconitate hydratase
MGQNIFQKIASRHLSSGSLEAGAEMAITIDQTLTHDATGTLTYLQFEALDVPRVKVDLALSYVDHNTLQTGFENADDHRFLQSIAAKYGLKLSRAGNGICHQVHVERFAVPGQTLLGSDSHTPTCGGLGMLAIGAGGLDVAVAMAGTPFYLNAPKVLKVELLGKRKPWVAAKDVILEVLRRLTVQGGIGRVLEYGGEGVGDLSVPERATIANMGTELGATSSLFPSDERALLFLRAQNREKDWSSLEADPDAVYDEKITIDLGALEPLVALPHSPDRVVPVREAQGTPLDQVYIGSCTNSSFRDLMRVAAILRGKRVHPKVSLVVGPGTRQVLLMLARNGALADLVAAGARILECVCGPCVGMGQAPPSNGASLRTNNRNFPGRCGTADARVYLASPETAAASALEGVLTDPASTGPAPAFPEPDRFLIDDGMFLEPSADPQAIEILRGPNIRPLPRQIPLEDRWEKEVLIKVGDHLTTDHIVPAGAKLLPLRSNIPVLSGHVFEPVDPSFSQRAKEKGGGFIVAGINYGQGSSREVAALCPMALGVKAVLAKSFARIHRTNLINVGILPLTFVDPKDYDEIQQGDRLVFTALPQAMHGKGPIAAENRTRQKNYALDLTLSPREREIILAGGYLNYARKHVAERG